MKVNDAAKDLIRSFEGFEATAYLDEMAKPPVWTIGYGTTARAGVGIEPRAGMTITKAEAEIYFAKTVEKFAAKIAAMITAPINPNEFGAMVSLAYNIGPGAFSKSSVLRRFNAGDKIGAADAFLLWNKAGGKVWPGLVRRRKAERALFLAPVAIATEEKPVPTPVGPPVQMDRDNRASAPAPSWLASIIAVIIAIFGGKK